MLFKNSFADQRARNPPEAGLPVCDIAGPCTPVSVAPGAGCWVHRREDVGAQPAQKTALGGIGIWAASSIGDYSAGSGLRSVSRLSTRRPRQRGCRKVPCLVTSL